MGCTAPILSKSCECIYVIHVFNDNDVFQLRMFTGLNVGGENVVIMMIGSFSDSVSLHVPVNVHVLCSSNTIAKYPKH